jgi:hypothetical protein
MPVVTLDRVWLHDSDDLATYVTSYSADRADERRRSVDVRTYAGGRRRAVTRVDRRQALQVMLRLVDAATLDQLDDWIGHVLMFRDRTGRLVFGTYAALAVVDHDDDGTFDVSFSFEDVTHSIEV